MLGASEHPEPASRGGRTWGRAPELSGWNWGAGAGRDPSPEGAGALAWGVRTHSRVGGSSRRLVTGSASAEGRDPGVRGQGCGRAGARCPLASGEATSHRWGDSGSCPGPRRSGMGPEAEAPSGDTAASPMPLGGWPRGARPPQPRGRPRERRGSRAPVPSLLHRSESSGGARDQPAREWLSRSRRPPCDPPGGGARRPVSF